MIKQIQRWCVIAVPDSVSYIFIDEADARARHELLTYHGIYDPDQIYVAQVTMVWSEENRVFSRVEGE